MKIAPGIYGFKSPIDTRLKWVNCYLIEGNNGWLMIDTGWSTSEAYENLQAQLKTINISIGDISKIVLTHVHPDHFGLAGKIKQLSPRSEVFMHRLESDLVESRYVKFAKLRDEMSAMLARHGVPQSDLPNLDSASIPALNFVTLTFPDTILFGGEIISTGIYDLEIIWTPGHSPGHICLFEPNNQLLFTGDHILPSITPNIGAHVQSGDNPLGDYFCSLRKLENLEVSRAFPAHEDSFTDLHSRIQNIIRHHDERIVEILKIIKSGYHTAWEIASRTSWNVSEPWDQMQSFVKRSAVTETIAHLDYMRWKGSVEKTIKENSITFHIR